MSSDNSSTEDDAQCACKSEKRTSTNASPQQKTMHMHDACKSDEKRRITSGPDPRGGRLWWTDARPGNWRHLCKLARLKADQKPAMDQK